MGYLAFRKIPTEDRPDLDNYVVCIHCLHAHFSYSEYERLFPAVKHEMVCGWHTWPKVWSSVAQEWIPKGWEGVELDHSVPCWRCHFKIDEPVPVPRVRKKSWCREKQVWRPDTRRIAASGKMIGGHYKGVWHGIGVGKYWKNQFNRAERRYHKSYAKAYQDDPEFEPRVSWGSFRSLWSEVSWHAT